MDPHAVYGYLLYYFTISIGLQFYNIIKIEKNEEKFKVRKRVMVQQPWSHYLTTPDQTTSCQERSPVHLNAHCLSPRLNTRRPSGQRRVDTWMRFQLQHISHGSLRAPLRVPVKQRHHQTCETFVHLRMQTKGIARCQLAHAWYLADGTIVVTW